MSMKFTDKPWGYEVLSTDFPHAATKRLVVFPGRRLSRQYHTRSTEVMVLVDGSAWLEGEWANWEMVPFRGYTFTPGEVHRLTAGEDGCTVYEISDANLHKDNETIRLEDDYGRTS